MSIYDTLNAEQQKAVFRTEGPVLILAGAGSGKTRVITHRIAYLIDELGVNPWNILAITFTNKAAGEMRERVDKLVGFGAESVWVSTFHSMCVRILRRHIDLLGYQNSFAIYDTDDQKSLMKEVMKSLNIDPKMLKERTILSAISNAKNELAGPLHYREEHQNDYTEKQIADAYDEYQRRLYKNNALDFDDLLMKTVELLTSHDEVRENYQNRFRYIMVDEYQDTNTAQFEIIRLLSGKYRNLCVVGDDDQSIYKFRGANINNILDFEKVFPDAMTVRLEQNYRSTQNVLDAANAVIKNNINRKSKSLWTDHGAGEKIRFRQFDTAYEEARFIAEDIEDQVSRNSRLNYSDFAVLYRTNAQARVLEERFVLASIPYNIVGGTNFYARREIKDLLAYLKTIDNGVDDIAVERIINVPRRGIGQTTISRLQEYALQNGLSLFGAMERAGTIQSMGRTSVKIKPFVDLINSFKTYAQASKPSDVLKKVIADTGYVEELKDSDEEDAEDRISNIDELISKVTDYEESVIDGVPTLSGFLEEVALVADIDQVEGGEKVLLMTLHSAKGLEFPYVYLAGLEDGVFPGEMTIQSGDEEEMAEERRLAYVGITRAKDVLTITCAKSRMLRGETRYNPVSRFVREIPAELMDSAPAKKNWHFDDDDTPFADYDSGADSYRGYGSSGSYGGSAKGASSYYGDGGRGRKGNEGYENTRGYGSVAYMDRQNNYDRSRGSYGGSGSSAGSTGSGRRLKATYVKPHTAEEKKPFIARANDSHSRTSSLGAAGRMGGLAKGADIVGAAPDYGPGDRVVHVKFGEGTVKAVEQAPRDYKVTVDFDEFGTKVMYAGFAKLEKL